MSIKEPSPWQNALLGAFAGVVTRLFISPFDVVKIRYAIVSFYIRLQIQPDSRRFVQDQTPKYTSFTSAVQRIAREEGMRGLFKGNMAAEYLYLSYGGLQFLTYHQLEKWSRELNWNNRFKIFLCGGISFAYFN
jgi:solute carrier family 25 thiamine pyrophosphate transporter 19